jgi:putative sigma-54 modulation protein
MQISFTARHCEIAADVRSFAEQRLEKFERFARDIREAHLIVTHEKYRHTAEITLKLNHHEMVSSQQSTDVRAAIDLAADHLEHQLRRLKDRRADRKHGPQGLEGEVPGESAAGDGEPGRAPGLAQED